MMGYGQLSVAKKIQTMIMLSTAGALLLASIVFISVEVLISRHALVDRVSVLAVLVATHVTAALSFDDPETAEKLLQSMSAEPDIIQAVIFNTEGERFAHFIMNNQRNHSDQSDEISVVPDFQQITEQKHAFKNNRLQLISPIMLDDERIGFLYVEVSLNSLFHQIVVYFLGVFVILLVVLLLAYSLSSILHRRISGPIAQLLKGMKQISKEEDYSLRIHKGDQDEIGNIIEGFNDVIEQIEKRNELIQQKNVEVEQHAFYDALTGLPNRRLLMKQLDKEIARSHRQGTVGAVLFMDLDHFKTINDSLGHGAGDLLLIEVSNRIATGLRLTDTSARVGGDEFVVILPELSLNKAVAADHAQAVAEAIRYMVSQPYEIEKRTIHTSPSIGITLFSPENGEVSDIIRQADLAMYRAKDDGRNLVQFFSEDMQSQVMERLQIEEDLRLALDNDGEQLELYFQPQVNSVGKIAGAEALLRWHHPTQGGISPAVFVPVAETTGLIHPLGHWVLTQACQKLALWQRKGLQLHLAVNVSAHEFLQVGFVNRVLEVIQETGIDPHYLELEITEGVFLRDIEETVKIMEELKHIGVHFAIDDFGTGYSSLQYLKTLPLEKLKIDQSFVRDITSDPDDAAIVNTIIAMTKSLDIKVIAEGVETEEERLFLYENGCDSFQGYFFYKPLPAAEFEACLKEQKCLFTLESCSSWQKAE